MADLTLYTAAEVAEILRMNQQVIQRKLQAGEIPAYRIGREWRVEKEQLLAWLERHSNQVRMTPDQKVVATYLDDSGRLTKIPDKRSKREPVLRWLATALEQDRTYSERELNDVLGRYHDDVAWIRRELVSMKLLFRTKDGIYKRAAKTGRTSLRPSTSAASATRRRAGSSRR